MANPTLIPVQPYATGLRVLHWIIGTLMIALICIGLYMADLPRSDVHKLILVDIHKSVGVLVLLLACLRLYIRASRPVPPMIPVRHPVEAQAARGVHWSLYVFMFALPITGYVMSTAAGYSVEFFKLFTLPKLFGIHKALGGGAHTAHVWLGYALIGFITLHVLGALKHQFWDRYPIFRRIWW